MVVKQSTQNKLVVHIDSVRPLHGLGPRMCSVVSCDSWSRGAPRFKLPEDPERRLQWVQFILQVNGQQLKESSWTDITICKEHFTTDCFELMTDPVQLKPEAVPSLCVKAEPVDHELKQEPEETTEVDFECVQIKTCDSPSSSSEQSGRNSMAAQESPAPSDASDANMSDHGPTLQKLPIPSLPITAYTAKTSKRKYKKKVQKKELPRARDKTRVNIGAAFPQWRELRDRKGFKTDAELAVFLLDRKEKKTTVKLQ